MHNSRILATLIAVGLITVAGGCQNGQQTLNNTYSDNLQLSRADLPDYAVGEYFVFDDGTTAVVTGISREEVTWRYQNGAISTRYRNFVLPALAWTSASSQSQTTLTASPDMLWPLATGNRGQYESYQVISRNDRIESTQLSRKWECAVEGTERVSVPAGTFDTYVVACKRYSTASNSWRATRKYYYAPETSCSDRSIEGGYYVWYWFT